MTSTLSSVFRLVLVVAFIYAASVDCLAQAARPDRGVTPAGSYSISEIENINLTNGNLNLSIPLASLPPMAGSKLGFTLRAEYNSKGWDTMREELQSDPLNPATKYIVTHLQRAGGWRIGGTYQLSFEDITWDYTWLPPPPNDPEYNLLTSNRWSKVVLIGPDGATHELRPVDYQPYADTFSAHNYLRGYYKNDPNTGLEKRRDEAFQEQSWRWLGLSRSASERKTKRTHDSISSWRGAPRTATVLEGQ